MTMLYRKVRYLTHDFTFAFGDLLIKDGQISRIDEPGQIDPQEANDCIDGQGKHLYPGLIDLHVHGADGVDTMDEDPQALPHLSRFLARQGITAFLATSTAARATVLARVFEQRQSMPGAQMLGFHMEGPFIHPDKKGALSGAYLRAPDLAEMKRYSGLRRLTLAPETDGALDFIRTIASQKTITVSLGHTTADYDLGLKAFAAGARSLTHLFNAMPPFLHRDPGIIGAALDADAYAELISDGIHIHPAVVRAAYKLFGPERLILISDSMRATGLQDGHYDLGDMKVTVLEGIARTQDQTIAGSTFSLWQCVKQAHAFGIPLESAMRMASLTPATLLGEAGHRGSIQVGKTADLVLTDGRQNIESVWIAGQKVAGC